METKNNPEIKPEAGRAKIPVQRLVMRVEATLSASLDIDCPQCKHSFDLFENDCDTIYTPQIFNNQWDFLEGAEVVCPECEHEFEIAKVVW